MTKHWCKGKWVELRIDAEKRPIKHQNKKTKNVKKEEYENDNDLKRYATHTAPFQGPRRIRSRRDSTLSRLNRDISTMSHHRIPNHHPLTRSLHNPSNSEYHKLWLTNPCFAATEEVPVIVRLDLALSFGLQRVSSTGRRIGRSC